MTIFDEFKLYRDKYGLNSISQTNGVGDTSQNGTLFTMQYLICLQKNASSNIVHEEIERLKEGDKKAYIRIADTINELAFIGGVQLNIFVS